MCGRFTLTKSARELAERFAADVPAELSPRFNIAPGQPVATLDAADPAGSSGATRRTLRLRHWGLVPPWASDPGVGARMINARAETAAEKPAFRDALRRRRCLVPADGFYEWGDAGSGGRQPYHIALRGGELFAMAGLWERWAGPDGAALESCALLTTAADEPVRVIHDRRPVILAPGDYDAWLDPELRDVARLGPLLRALPGDALALRAVSPRVNDARIDEPGLLDRYEPPRAPVQESLF